MCTRPSSANLEISFTRSLRRSSVSVGIGMRTTLPSSVGFKPRFASLMPLQMALITLLSHGWTTSSRGSGALTELTCCSGTCVPYASTLTVSSSCGLALPVRIPPSSWRTNSVAFFIRSSASTSVLDGIGSLPYDGAHGFAVHDLHEVATHPDIEHDQRQAV